MQSELSKAPWLSRKFLIYSLSEQMKTEPEYWDGNQKEEAGLVLFACFVLF